MRRMVRARSLVASIINVYVGVAEGMLSSQVALATLKGEKPFLEHSQEGEVSRYRNYRA